MAVRAIRKTFRAPSQKEGAGFTINRPFPGRELKDVDTDPFLLFDEMGPVEYAAGEFEGAPWHPHRGFVTVTYLKAGEGRHQDSMGNSGIVRAGEVQWMSAASGIVHDEGRDHPGGLLHGFQLWVNLPAKHKMDPPSYQQLTKDHFVWQAVPPTAPSGPAGKGDALCEARIKVISGSVEGIATSPIKNIVPVLYADVTVSVPATAGGDSNGDGTVDIPIPAEMTTAIAYVYSGAGAFYSTASEGSAPNAPTLVAARDTVVFEVPSPTDRNGASSCRNVPIRVGGKPGTTMCFMLLCGVPIGEPIARHGPFVMNTNEELKKAAEDYHRGKFATVKGSENLY